VVGGLASVSLINAYGWRAPFAVGAVATVVLVRVVIATMPESITFLLARRPRNALAHANRLLTQIRQPVLAELPARTAAPGVAGSVRAAVLGRRAITMTLLIWVAFFCTQAVYFFANSWTPGCSRRAARLQGRLHSPASCSTSAASPRHSSSPPSPSDSAPVCSASCCSGPAVRC
jgi:MFS family permease